MTVVGLLVGMLLLFPTGQPPSRRWWVLVWAVAAGVVLTWVGAGLAPAHYQDFPGVENPFGIVALATVLKRVEGVGGILFAAGVLGTLASLVVRFARARGLGAPAAQVVRVRRRARLCTAGAADPPIPDFLKWTLAPVSLSAAAAVAVLRYRLYDIDRLINRTLVYGGLTAVLGLGYAGQSCCSASYLATSGSAPPVGRWPAPP